MTELTIHLKNNEYQRLEHAAKHAGKSVQSLVHEWIDRLTSVEEPFDITQDPVFKMEGYDSNAPADMSTNLDNYLYGQEYPK